MASNGRIVVGVGSHWVDGVSGSGSGLSAVSTDGEKWSFRTTQGFKNSFRVRWANDRFFALHLNVLASLALNPGRSARKTHSHWEMKGGWMIRRLPEDGKAGRARLFDTRGLLVRDLAYAAGAAQARIPLSGLGRGTYVLQTVEGGERISQSVPLVR